MKRPGRWYTRGLRWLARWVDELAGDGWDDYAPEVPRTLDDFRRAIPTRTKR